jgi:hypothetical protein
MPSLPSLLLSPESSSPESIDSSLSFSSEEDSGGAVPFPHSSSSIN